MGSKYSKDGKIDIIGNKINELMSEFLTNEKVNRNKEDVYNKIAEEVIKTNYVIDESRARNVIHAAVNIADRINAKYVMSNKKINSDLYSTIMLVENEKLFKDFDQLEFIQKFFNANNIFDSDDQYGNVASLFTRSKINDKESTRLTKLKRIPLYDHHHPENEITNLSDIKIVETEIEKKTECENSLGSIVIPTEMFDKSFEELSLQDYLNMETQRLRLNKPTKNTDLGKIEKNKNKNFLSQNLQYRGDKFRQPDHIHKQSKDKIFDPTGMNLMRNKHLENNKNNNKFNDLSFIDRSVKIKINFKGKENLKINKANTFNRNLEDIKGRKIGIDSEYNNYNSQNTQILNGFKTKTQSTNLTINLQRSNTSRSEFNKNKERSISKNRTAQNTKLNPTNKRNNSKLNQFSESKQKFDTNRSNKDKEKYPPIACIRIDIRDLMKEENLEIHSDHLNTDDGIYLTKRNLYDKTDRNDPKYSNQEE